MCTLPLLAGDNVSDRFVVPTVASSIDLVLHLAVDSRGRRRATELVAVPGRVESGVVELEQLFINRGNGLLRADGYPPHQDRFARAGYRLTELLAA